MGNFMADGVLMGCYKILNFGDAASVYLAPLHTQKNGGTSGYLSHQARVSGTKTSLLTLLPRFNGQRWKGVRPPANAFLRRGSDTRATTEADQFEVARLGSQL